MNPDFSIAIHGGAGTLIKGNMTADKEKAYKAVLQHALEEAFEILKNKGTSLDAVEKAVRIMEDSPLFNAGKGSVFTSTGKHEMDAAIMEGKDRQAGAVSLVSGIRNPVSLARKVLEESPHVFLAGQGAIDFAKLHGCQFENDDYFYDDFRHGQWEKLRHSSKFQLDHSDPDTKFGTVGAVACDQFQNLAAATSTGGMTNKGWGRIGDSPLIGIGNYANNKTCAVSCTGSGEYFIRGVVAYDLSCLMEFKELSLDQAAQEAIHRRLLKINGDGGLIAVDAQANVSMPFNTEGMYRGMRHSNGQNYVRIYED